MCSEGKRTKQIYQSPDAKLAVVFMHICRIYMARKHQRMLKFSLLVAIM